MRVSATQGQFCGRHATPSRAARAGDETADLWGGAQHSPAGRGLGELQTANQWHPCLFSLLASCRLCPQKVSGMWTGAVPCTVGCGQGQLCPCVAGTFLPPLETDTWTGPQQVPFQTLLNHSSPGPSRHVPQIQPVAGEGP